MTGTTGKDVFAVDVDFLVGDAWESLVMSRDGLFFLVTVAGL
jgi:hypothetical protein